MENFNLRDNQTNLQPSSMQQAGFSILEVIVSIFILAVFSLAIAKNTVGAMRFSKFTEVNHIASSLAISKVEELAAVDAASLDNSINLVEAEVAWPGLGITFTRTTTLVVNADNSRTVKVKVVSNGQKLPADVEFRTTFALWE